MKLISYHIENYGKLQEQDGTFENGVSCFYEENGHGKTTLTSFIKAMFYGLDSYTGASKSQKDTSLALPERKHFYPFAGGKFGGNITFEKDGKTYRIERFFDEKSEAKDKLTVYCNNNETNEFGMDVGKAVFGVDKESFCKTVFITADEVNISSTHSINEKLNRAVETSEGERDYEQTHKVLSEAKKKIKSARSGLYFDTNKRIGEIKTEIHGLEKIKNALKDKYKERQKLCEKQEELSKLRDEAQGRATLLAQWAHYDEEQKRVSEMTATQKSLLSEYPNGIPSEDERKILSDCLQKESELKGSLSSSSLSAEQSYRLQSLQDVFPQGTPSEGLLAEQGDYLQKITALETELNGLKNTQKSGERERLENKFKHNPLDDGKLHEMQALLEKYKTKKRECDEMSNALLQGTMAQEAPKKKNNFGVILLAIAVVVCALGVGLVFVQKIVGIALVCVGGVGVVAGIILALAGGKSSSAPVQKVQVNEVAVKMKSELGGLEDGLKAKLIPYGYYSGNLEVDFNNLKNDWNAYTQGLMEDSARQTQLDEKTNAKQALEEKVRAFLQSYGVAADNLQAGMNDLRGEINEYKVLRQAQRNAESRKTQAEEDLDELRKNKKEILAKYGLSEANGSLEGIDQMAKDSREIVRLSDEIEKGKANANTIRTKHNLTVRPEGEMPDVALLSAQLNGVNKELSVLDQNIADDENNVEKLGDLENRQKEEVERLESYEARNNILEKALQSLENAEQNLKDKYVKPIQDKFAFYAEAIGQVLNERVEMDKDYRIQFEKNGQKYEERHLSAGERSICALCLRLALIDNMYETEQPFIVMDDPFVYLDDAHMEKAAELVKTLAKDRQILYFCCHESRAIQ